LPGVILSGVFVYFTLSYVLIPERINLPISIITCVLIFGLAKYYYLPKEENIFDQNKIQKIEKSTLGHNLHNIVFVVIYVLLLTVIINTSSSASSLFVEWEEISPIQILSLAAAIAFSFFLPGYALVTVLNKKYHLRPLLRVLLAYLFSILITGLGGYISGSFGYQISNNTMFFIGAYIVIFLFYSLQLNAFSRSFYHVTTYAFLQSLSKTSKSLLNNYSQFIVFSSLFALVILYTYYLNDGKIVVDEWYHHGRALLIESDLFKDLGATDKYIPPFFPSLLAAFFNLSSSPSVNAYVAISFLNIIPVFAFYYFFTSWVPKDKQRAALLASTLFMLSSGFGWLYLSNLAIASHDQVTFDLSSSLNIISIASIRTFDIWTPTTFINVGHPDVTTALIIIALPAGFTLLGFLKEVKFFNLCNNDDNTFGRSRPKYFPYLTYIAIITALSFLGILSHDEYYLFIIVVCITIVVLFRTLPKNVNYLIFFVSFLLAISFVILVDIVISPARFYTSRTILGIPLIFICLLLVSSSWAVYASFRKLKFSNIFNFYRIKRGINIKSQGSLKKVITLGFFSDQHIRFLKLSLAIVVVIAVAYFYLFTLLVWNTLSVNEMSSQIKEFSNVPWYFYPVKFGITGLFGLAFLLSYLFKKFETEIFIYGIIVIIAFFAGPYYDEHRFGKYVMTGMAAFAALLIYKIIASRRIGSDLRVRALIVGVLLGIVITSSCLSIFFYAGWNEQLKGKREWIEGGRRDFPTPSEIRLLNFLNSKIIDSKAYNIALPEKETSNEQGFVTKIYGFSPTSREKLLQNPLTLNASTVEGLYNLLNHTNVKYILLPKTGIVVDKENEGNISPDNNSYYGNTNNVMRFVLDNFPKAYEDENYIILQVLPLTPPAPKNSNVAFVYQRDFADLSSLAANTTTILPMDLELSESQIVDNDSKNNSRYYSDIDIRESKEGKNDPSYAYSLTLGDKFSKNNSKIITLLSHPIQQTQQHNLLDIGENNHTGINYIEGNFRIIDELPVQNKSEEKNANKFGAGIVWERGNSIYLASISEVGLQLSQSPSEITLLTKQLANATGTAIAKANKIVTAAAGAHTNATGKVTTNGNIGINSAIGMNLIMSQNEEVKRQKGIWYNFKILFLKNNVEIYLNDILRMKVPLRENYNFPSNEKNFNDSISRVGINSYYSRSEFQPIRVGQIDTEHPYPRYQKIYYEHYYPLSLLALSKIKYDAHAEGDLSAFSKKYVVLPFDKSSYKENEASTYMEYVSNGGNLIVINSDNKFDGVFSKLFSLEPANLTKFSGIESNNLAKTNEKNSQRIYGIARSLLINPNGNLTVKSYYVNRDDGHKSQNVAPFAIEKVYGKGKIILVNADGYFDSIFGKTYTKGNNTLNIKTPYFGTLSNIAPLIGISDANLVSENNTMSISSDSMARIIGDIRISSEQKIIINSSNVLLPDSNSSPKKPSSYNISADDVYVSASESQQILFTNHNLFNNVTSNAPSINNSYYFKKVLIKNIDLSGGPFEVIINVTNSTRPLYLPTSLSYNDNIAMSIPKGFDMTVKFSDSNSTNVQFDMMKKDDKNSFQRIKISGYKNGSNDGEKGTVRILFHNVRGDLQDIRYLTAIMKSPEIRIIKEEKNKDMGNPVSLRYKENSPDSTPVEIQKGIGDITMNIDHVDNYDEHYQNWTRTKFTTYIKNDVQVTDENNNVISRSKGQPLFTKLTSVLPGDISEYAKKHGIIVPWRDVVSSIPSITIALVLLAVGSLILLLTWHKIIKFNKKM
jgi:hypothetical protein